MFLKTMEIIDKNHQVIRTMNFTEGLNLVVDEESSDAHNHVGKTTALKLIDIALGSRDKKYIYVDSNTGAKNTRLEELVNKNKLSVTLSIVSSLKKPKADNILKVDLYERGHKYINDQPLNERDYDAELNKLFFDNDSNNPTFRKLIHSFVRVSAKKDSYDFLHNLVQNTTNLTYRSIYDYLFNIKNAIDSSELNKLTTSLNQVKKSDNQYRSLGNNNYSSEVINQLILATKKEVAGTQSKIDIIIKGTDFLSKRKQISEYREIYVKREDEISELKYEFDMISNDINQSNMKNKLSFSSDLTKDLFKEIKHKMPQIDKTYQDLINFNNALNNNRTQYLSGIKEKLDKKIKIKEQEQTAFLKNNENLIGLIKNDDISKYDSLNEQLMNAMQRLNELEEKQKTLNAFADKKNSIEEKIFKMKRDNKDNESNYQEQLNIFNSFFTPIANSLSDGSPIMVYHVDETKFPLSIEDLDEGTSTGTLKTMIICYDISYQKFAKKINKTVPQFMVHDILENIDGNVLKKVINEVSEANCQMVIGILREKLKSSGISETIQKDHQLLSLSDKDRLFEPLK